MFIAVALLVAGLFIAFLLHHFIQRQVDERLDSQILFLASMLRADNSTLSLSGSADGPPAPRTPPSVFVAAEDKGLSAKTPIPGSPSILGDSHAEWGSPQTNAPRQSGDI